MAADRPEARMLARRVSNPGAHEFGSWARGEPGSLLGRLWSRRQRRTPMLIVIDSGLVFESGGA